MSPIEAAALKFVVPALGSAIILARFRKSPALAETLRFPAASQIVLWVTLYLSWMIATDFVFDWRGPWDFAPWLAAPIIASVLRVLAVVFAGPLLEELVFRGLAFSAIKRSVAGPLGAVLMTSAFWSVLHWSYEPAVIAIIMVGGIILGAARWRTGSLYLPVAMHMLWNAYAIW